MTTILEGHPVNNEAYPFSASEPVPGGYTYAFVKDQVDYKTGVYSTQCPHCRKANRTRVGRPNAHMFRNRTCRKVSTTCRHCGTNVSFMW